MADVIPSRSDRSDGDRGQLLLTIAFTLALMFVVLAIYLNTAIYTENLATRESDIAGSRDAIRYQEVTERAVAGSMAYVNHHNNSSTTDAYEHLDRNFSEGLSSYDRLAGQHEATAGHSTNLSITGTTNGTRIVQDADRNFSNASGTGEWELVSGTENVRAFEMNVTRGPLGGSTPADAPSDDIFTLAFDNGTEVWEVRVYDDTGAANDITVSVVDDSDTTVGTCRVTDSRTVVDVTGARVGNESCPSLRFVSTLGSSYDIAYNNTSSIEGTYELYVTNEKGTIDDSDYHDEPSGDSPYLTEAIYSAEVQLDFETSRVRYSTTIRVAPGEQDA